MTDKAVITRRDVDREAGAEIERGELQRLGLAVEYELPLGMLVAASAAERLDLEQLGYRVKLLPETNILSIGQYDIDIEQGEPAIPDHLRVPDDRRESWPHHLVQLIAPPIEEWNAAIAARGIVVVEPVAAYGLFVAGSQEAVTALRGEKFVAWTGLFQPAYRLDEDLIKQQGLVQNVSIGVYPPEQAGTVQQEIARIKGKNLRASRPRADYHGEYATLLVEVAGEHLAEIARLPYVRWLELASPRPLLAGEREVQIVAGNVDGAGNPRLNPPYRQWLASIGLGGQGVCVAICDSGVDANADNPAQGHRDLGDRQVQFASYTGAEPSSDVSGHGTVVASIAVGNASTNSREAANGFLWGLGVAPLASFVTQNATASPNWPVDLADLTREAVQLGADIMNNSWSDNWQKGYREHAQTLDKLARDPDDTTDALEHLVIVCAAGNGGAISRSIWPPHEAKNIIVVGASNSRRDGVADAGNINSIWSDSSRGPARDGRYLPTVVAPGTAVSAARSATSAHDVIPGTGVVDPATGHTIDAYMFWSGTSMAAPHVAGCCAVVIEWWRKRNANVSPSPAMVKALLINGAVDLSPLGGDDGDGSPLAPIPNNDQGWGRVNLRNIIMQLPQTPGAQRGPSLYVDQTHVFHAGSAPFVRRIVPASQNRPLRITLVWTDAPGGINTGRDLVNDLDLEVTKLVPETHYKGNVFANGFSTPGGNFDVKNNVECVYIKQPSGAYTVSVIPSALRGNAKPPFDSRAWQDFALVIENARLA